MLHLKSSQTRIQSTKHYLLINANKSIKKQEKEIPAFIPSKQINTWAMFDCKYYNAVTVYDLNSRIAANHF